MKFEDEEYVRLYTRDTPTWKLLGWEGRTVLLLMLRGNFDRAGVFDAGGTSRNVTDSHNMSRLSRAVRAVTELPKAVVDAGLQQILDEEVWEVTARGLYWPGYLHAQTCARSDRARKQAERARRAKEAEQSAASRNVTECHAVSRTSRNVTPEPYRSLTGASPPTPQSGGQRTGEQARVLKNDSKIPCPSPAELLSEGQRATLESSRVPGWAIDDIVAEFSARKQADDSDVRTITNWRKMASKVICEIWNNPSKRPKKPEQPITNEQKNELRAKREAALKRERAAHHAKLAERAKALGLDTTPPPKGRAQRAALLALVGGRS